MKEDQVLKEVFQAVKNSLENPVDSVYLTGSRLYGFAEADSDYDMKVYVLPTLEDLALNRSVSQEVQVNGQYVEKVDVKDVRYMYKELTTPSYGSLHLLKDPWFGEPLVSEEQTQQLFADGKKNLVMSLLGTYRSKTKSMSPKDLAHQYFLCQHAQLFWNDEYVLSHRVSQSATAVRKGVMFVNQVALTTQADELFNQVKGTPKTRLDGQMNELVVSALKTKMSLMLNGNNEHSEK